MAVIDVQGLTYTYPGSAAPALKNLHFQIEAGEMVAVVGANGTGKSSLCLALSGLIPHLFHGHLQGRVAINGLDTLANTPGQLAGQVGLVLQNPANQLSGMRYTVYEEVAFGLENLGLPPAEMPARIERALALTGLDGLGGRSPYALSGGQQQRLALASILALEPPVLILDEPTAMLDPQGGQRIFDILQKLTQTGVTVVIAEHRLEWIARTAGRVIALDEGEIVLDGAPGDVLASPLLMEIGVGWTRYTQAAHLGRARRLWPDDLPLPVTLEQAVSGFRQGTPPMHIQLDNVHFAYPGGPAVLRGISLSIQPGEQVALVGENGSGKTTLARHLNGLLRPQTGSVAVGDWRTSDHSPAKLARRVAYVFQNPDEQLFRQTVWDEVAFGPQNLGLPAADLRRAVQQALDWMGLGADAPSNPRDLGYSGRKRVALASALAMQTLVLVLDEPTAGLDAGEQAQLARVLALLSQAGKTVLVISHDMDFVAENLERVLLMRQGQVVLDAPVQDFFAQGSLLESAGLVAPQITRLSQALGQSPALTVTQFLDGAS